MTRHGVPVCHVQDCFRTLKPGTTACLNHQPRDAAEEERRIAEVFEARSYHKMDKAYWRLVNVVLEEGKTVQKPRGV